MIAFPDSVSIEAPDSDLPYIKRVLNDYYLACVSREASILGRKEVLTGKAKFGILGDGKEIAQVALAHFYNKGDFRSGYYRDQTLMMALGLCSLEDYFAQLYADPENDPYSGGRQMNNHFATPLIDGNDNWLNHTDKYNVSSDISSTGGQMARALGLALASKKYRELDIDKKGQFSDNGNEVVFCTIGDASTSEGVFWETLNAASVMKVPLVILVWDDGYGISVPIELQTTKGSISKASEGFLKDEKGNGISIYTAKAWDYSELVNVYDKAVSQCREDHRPVMIHVQECTQPQGHSTSGSHERYKSKERLEWEKQYDGIKKMREWILESGLAQENELQELESKAKQYAKEGSKSAWNSFQSRIKVIRKELTGILQAITPSERLNEIVEELKSPLPMNYGEVLAVARELKSSVHMRGEAIPEALEDFIGSIYDYGSQYSTHLYSQADSAALNIPVVAPEYSDDSKVMNGFEIVNTFFDQTFEKYPQTFAFGEDVGNIGDVNQGFAGLQEKYGEERIFDSGIREWTIMGQAIGMAMRGLRPIAEIQYLDYFVYGLTPLTDDLATLRYRSNNLQMAPAIIRTRGHRLEGIWHAGSPLGLLINSLRGIHLCVPRNFVQAAGMYNTLLRSTDPGVVIEVLNGYRLKETLPDNMGDYTVPLGVPEVIMEGNDLTVVTYGANVRYAKTAIERLSSLSQSIELIDVQTLLPFDLEHKIVESLKKTNKILFLDEDVPGGGTAYMMQKVLEEQGGYFHLDGRPRTLTAKAHRCAFGSDGDYFSKPQIEDIVEVMLDMLGE